MQIKKKGVGISAGLLTYFFAKFILGKVGIENIPAPMVVGLLAVAYALIVVGVDKNKFTVKEKRYFIICASLLAVAFISIIIGVILTKYFPWRKDISLVMFIIFMASFIGAILAALKIKKD
jgi:predicted permease